MTDAASRLTITPSDDGQTFVLVGEIDAHTSPLLADQLDVLPDGDGDITIEMSDVGFIDSSGLRVIIDVHQRAAEVDRRLVLHAPSSAVSRLVEIAGLTEHLNLTS